MSKINKKQKVSLSNILGAIGALSGLATGFFMLYAEFSSYNVFPYRPEYHSYDIWKLAAAIMFLISLACWTMYILYAIVHSRKTNK